MSGVSIQEIELMNKILETAVMHGGDRGGPYYSEGEALFELVKEWVTMKKLTNYEVVVIGASDGQMDGFVQIVRKDNNPEVKPTFYAC